MDYSNTDKVIKSLSDSHIITDHLQQKVNDILNAPEEFIEAAYDWFFAPENKGGINSMLREAVITGSYYEYLEVGLEELEDVDK